jgi:hypothetical protein
MTIEDELVYLLHDLTPEPPRELTMAQIASRVQRRNPAGQSRRRWVSSLAAAAIVVAVALGVAVTRNPDDRGSGPSIPAETVEPSPHTTSAPTPSDPRTTRPDPKDSGVVQLHGALLTLPAHWFARGVTDQTWPTWCLAPLTPLAPNPEKQACPVWFRAIPDPPGSSFDPDATSGPDGLSSHCSTQTATRHLIGAGFRRFGDRTADYRQWSFRCSDGARFTITQYVVATGPGYVLYSQHSDRTVQHLMSALAASAILPAQTTSLRYQILGNVQSVTHLSNGYHVRLQPLVRRDDGQFVPVSGGKADTYVIPDHLVPPGLEVNLVGPIALTTDGTEVTALTIIGG